MHILARRPAAWGVALLGLLSLGPRLCAAEPAQITFPDGTTRDVSVLGFGVPNNSPPVINGKDRQGATVAVGLDKMAVIKDITKDSALIVLRNGEEHRLAFGELLMAYQSKGGAGERV